MYIYILLLLYSIKQNEVYKMQKEIRVNKVLNQYGELSLVNEFILNAHIYRINKNTHDYKVYEDEKVYKIIITNKIERV